MIGKFESNKDLIQELTSSGAKHVGNIAGIITGTVAEVTREIGEWITDAIEMNEAAAAARRDAAAAARDGGLVDPEAGDIAKTDGSSMKSAEADAVYTADAVDADVAPTPYVEAEIVEPGPDEPR